MGALATGWPIRFHPVSGSGAIAMSDEQRARGRGAARPSPPAEPAEPAEPGEALGEAETVIRPRGGTPAADATPEKARETTAGDGPAATRFTEPESADAGGTPGVEPGSVLFGEYEILEVLGAGGMGEVYKARHRRLGEYRAIKLMHADLASKKGANEFFLREARALLAVRHPAVVHCHDLLSDERGRVFLIMEMIEGPSLGDRIDEGGLSAEEVVVLGARLAAGLNAAHVRGVVHRDVSPDNVVLPGGRVEDAKLIDFGIAKILEEGQGTIVDGFKGKLSYASPEQLGFFGGKIDGRSDFYSLGLVLCAAAMGRPIGMGATVVEAVDARRGFEHVPAEIPVGLRSCIEPLLALDPRDRPEQPERLFLAPGSEQAGLEAIRAEAARGSAPSASVAAGRLGVGAAATAVVLLVTAYWLTGPSGGEAPAASGQAPAEQTAAPSADAGGVAQPRPSTANPRPTEPVSGTDPRQTDAGGRQLSALDEVRIVGLLRGAEAALADDRLQRPKGDNAYEKYRAVLALDAGNTAARRGLEDVAGRYLQRGERARANGDVEKARTYLARAASIAPGHPRLDEVRAKLDGSAAGRDS